MTQETNNSGGLAGFNAARLFLGSCFALISTSVAFAVVGAAMQPLKAEFVLTNAQIGWIGGAALWGFTISIFIFGPLVDVMGMKFQLRLAFLAHLVGPLVMIFANGFTMLFVGALIVAMGNGLVEAVCNPLVATIYPDRKTEMLNKFHVWFPGGIVIGGLLSYFLDQVGAGAWEIKLALIVIPTLIYGFLFLGQKFPATERVASGVSFGEMFKETFMRPLFLLLFFAMMLTASLELGPNRWVPAVLESVGIPGILVLVWINLLMAIMRYYAGPVIHKLAPTGILLISSVIGGIGLLWLSYTDSLGMALVAGTVFALGVCYFWPTMIGVTSERVPKGGSLALAMMGGAGMAIVGLVTSPLMGSIADDYLHEKLPPQETRIVLEQVVDEYQDLKADATPKIQNDLENSINAAKDVLAKADESGTLPEIETANALRNAMGTAPQSEAAAAAGKLLGPAENYGGKVSFRYVAPLSIVLVIIFGLLYINDKRKGGYKKEEIVNA